MTSPAHGTKSETDRLAGDLLTELGASLELRTESVTLPGTERVLTIAHPIDIDALLNEVEHDPEQNLPYWAELWPSGIALAATIQTEPAIVRSLPVLELGSGLGITAAAALEAGADLLATDYARESLLLTRANALRNVGRQPRTLRMNWRAPDPELLAGHPGGYPVVLAADVLYERRDIAPLLELFDRIVAPDGTLWLAEPGRPPASIFLESASRAGWTFSTSTCRGPWPDPADSDVIVRVHRMKRRLPPASP